MIDLCSAGCRQPAAVFKRVFPPISAAVVGALFLLNLYAAIEWRSLYADGVNFFLNVLEENGFFFIEPARRTVHLLQELPTIVALRAGVSSLGILAFIYGLTLQMLPLALTAACYPLLPDGDKPLFIFPLAHHLLGSMPAAYVPIVGGPVAASYFWLLLFLILFGRRRSAIAATVVLALAALSLHETMVVLMPILGVAAVKRSRSEASPAPRKLFMVLAVWFAVITIVPAWFIINPTVPEQRDNVLMTAFLLFGVGNLHNINVPAVMAVAAVMALGIVCWPGRTGYLDWLAVLLFAAFCLILDVLTLAWGESSRLFVPFLQFTARNLAVTASVPLAVCLLLTGQRPWLQASWMRPPVAALVLLLALGQIGWQAIGIVYWDRFVTDMEAVLASHSGFVPWRQALADVMPRQAQEMRRLSWDWTNAQLSVVLAPGGRVSTIIGVIDDRPRQQFDPTRPDQLPAAPQFNYARYLQALGATAR
jgi:hypothetical protein